MMLDCCGIVESLDDNILFFYYSYSWWENVRICKCAPYAKLDPTTRTCVGDHPPYWNPKLDPQFDDDDLNHLSSTWSNQNRTRKNSPDLMISFIVKLIIIIAVCKIAVKLLRKRQERTEQVDLSFARNR